MTHALTDEPEPVNALWTGEGGTGKTTALAMLANTGKVVAINAESGFKARALKKMGVKVENIEIWPDEGTDIDYDTMETEWLRIRETLHADPGAYVGVLWDSATEIQKKLTDVERVAAIARAARAGRERDPFVVDQDTRTKVNEQLRNLMRKYRDLPCHWGISASVRREQDDDGTVTYQPGVSPAVQSDLFGFVDTVCVTSVVAVGDEEEYRGLFRPHGKYRGKDRWNVTPKWLVDPTFDRLIAYVNEELTANQDPVMKAAKQRFLAQQKRETEEKK